MVQLPRPSWYNSPCTEAVTPSGTQAGATCGLHAFNHLAANAASLVGLPWQPVTKRAFEATALQARHGDVAANIVEPGGSNYDFAALLANFSRSNVKLLPLIRADDQLSPFDCHLDHHVDMPFADHEAEDGSCACCGYLVRTPAYGGHWIAVVSCASLSPGDSVGTTPFAMMCDSMHPTPFSITRERVVDMLLTATAENVHEHAHTLRSAVFYVGIRRPG